MSEQHNLTTTITYSVLVRFGPGDDVSTLEYGNYPNLTSAMNEIDHDRTDGATVNIVSTVTTEKTFESKEETNMAGLVRHRPTQSWTTTTKTTRTVHRELLDAGTVEAILSGERLGIFVDLP